MDHLDRIAVEKFQEYLRIDTSHPKMDYSKAVDFLRQYAEDLDLEFDIFWVVKDSPVVVMKLEGSKPELKSLLLNSHMDVVPVVREMWTYDPFSAHKDENGDIFARGAQDMKCVSIQYLEAIRRLKKNGNKNFKRTIFLTFTPGEETTENGMDVFAFTDYFKSMNVGFAFDEGIANPGKSFKLFYAERVEWIIDFIIPGDTGHASEFIGNTAADKLRRLMNCFLDFREKERQRMIRNGLKTSDVSSVNMTMVDGGVQANVVPAEYRVTFDMRLAIDVNEREMESRIDSWRKEADDGIKMTYQRDTPIIASPKPDPSKLWYRGLYKAVNELGIEVEEEILQCGTDSRFLRQQRIPVVGFSPMNNTRKLLHGHDEYLNETVFLTGIGIYEKIIGIMANDK